MSPTPASTTLRPKSTSVRTNDAMLYIEHEYLRDPEFVRMVEEAGARMEIGQLAYDARVAAGLSQKQLGKMVHLSAAQIDDLEMADFDGDSFLVLTKVLEATAQKLVLKPVQAQRGKAKPTPPGPSKSLPGRRRSARARSA